MTDAAKNWIGARSCDAASQDGFDVAAANDRALVLGRWPRSGSADARAAITAAVEARAAWRRAPRSERAHLLRQAARALDETPDPGSRIAARLTLEPDEMELHIAGIGPLLERAIADEAAAPEGIALHAPHWSEILREPARRLFSALVAGQCVVLLSDRRLPMAADSIAAALASAGLPPGVWSVLHEDGATALRELLSSRDVTTVCAAGSRADLQRLAREASDQALDVRPLCNKSHVVAQGDDPGAAAAFVVSAAFGRARALSGQAPDQVGRVLCHERVFSRFTAALLSALETDRDVRSPIPPIDGHARTYVTRVRTLGIDEGATLLHPAASPATPGEGALVFTNVDPFSRLAALTRPAPCVRLMRVVSDAAGAALAQSFDPPPSLETLSTSSGELDGEFDTDLR